MPLNPKVVSLLPVVAKLPLLVLKLVAVPVAAVEVAAGQELHLVPLVQFWVLLGWLKVMMRRRLRPMRLVVVGRSSRLK